MNRGGFSWNRFLGITKAKRRVSRATGIPWTKSGRQRKVGKAVMGGGCLVSLISMLGVTTAIIMSVVLIIVNI